MTKLLLDEREKACDTARITTSDYLTKSEVHPHKRNQPVEKLLAELTKEYKSLKIQRIATESKTSENIKK